MANRGRPSVYTDELAAEILARLEAGESLRSICRSEEMPAEATVRLWSKQEEHPFAAQYEKSRLIGYGAMAEELIEIADDGSNDWIERHDNDNKGYQANGEHIQRSRLRVDTRKWILSKMLPKVYGDKIAVGGAEDLPPVRVTDEDAARRILYVLQRVSH